MEIGVLSSTATPTPNESVASLPPAGDDGKLAWQLFEAEQVGPQLFDGSAGRAVAYSARSPDKETPNEDAVAIIEPRDGTMVIVVADGLGGQAAGQTASRIAVETVTKSVLAADGDEAHLRSAILDGIEQANRAVLDHGGGAATTLAIAEVCDCFFRSYHVGDSVIALMGQRGKVKFETISHSPIGYAVESGLMEADEALHHEDRHLISNCLGSNEMRIELGPSLPMAPYDTLVLASDGLADNVLPGEAVEVLKCGPLRSSAADMADLVRGRMLNAAEGLPSKPDDLTFVVFRRGTAS